MTRLSACSQSRVAAALLSGRVPSASGTSGATCGCRRGRARPSSRLTSLAWPAGLKPWHLASLTAAPMAHALHRKAQAVPAPPLLSAAFTSQGPRQAPFGPAFGPQREAPRRVQTGKRLARDAGAILGERVVLGLRDDDELLEYVSRGREARQRQRLATADQATEREKRVALAHRQACTLPTYPANLPCASAALLIRGACWPPVTPPGSRALCALAPRPRL